MIDSSKNLSQHCTLRYDASCPGDAPLRLNAVKCVLSAMLRRYQPVMTELSFFSGRFSFENAVN